jgi:hypothetical protein
MLLMPPARRAVLVALAALLGACIPGAFTVGATDGGEGDGTATGPDGAHGDGGAGADQSSGPDASGDQTAPGDSGADTIAPVDVTEAAPVVPDGYVVCSGTTVQCDVAGGQECCLNIYGTIGEDGGATYDTTMAACEALGGPNCGAYLGTGNNFDEQLPQTCSTAIDCPLGTGCCVPIDDAGALKFGTTIACLGTCNAPDRIICSDNGDCPNGHACLPETDPILGHLYARYCQ